MKRIKKMLSVVLSVGMLGLQSPLHAVTAGQEEWLFVDLPSVITLLSRSERVPASITTITAEDIRVTPARNMMDLMETYVPGFFFAPFTEDYSMGLRGISNNRNNKFLLVVNGRTITQKTTNGALSELQNWDLNDVERIDVVRGPGAVTYGPGAVAGVISIKTKNEQGLQAGTSYWGRYHSRGVHASYGADALYVYGSVTKTDGYSPVTKSNNGTNFTQVTFGSPQFGIHPTSMYPDLDGRPQAKFQIDYRINDSWKSWARYTRHSGGTYPVWGQASFNGGPNLDASGRYVDSWIAAIENQEKIGDRFTLKSMATIGSIDWKRREVVDWGNFGVSNNITGKDVNDPSFINMGSDSELFLRSILNYNGEQVNTAVGVEFAHEIFGPKLFTHDDFELGAYVPGPQSQFAGANTYSVGQNGWETNTYSLLFESNWEPNPLLGFVASARADKNTLDDNPTFSPRLSWSADWGEAAGLTKLIIQQSERSNLAVELKDAQRVNGKTSHELTRGAEAVYIRSLWGVKTSASYFYTSTDIIGWESSLGRNERIGTVKINGIELEAKREGTKWTVGGNHAYVKQVSFHPAPTTTAGANISYSNVTNNEGTAVAPYGNDLNRAPNHMTKLFVNYKPTVKTHFHVSARADWDYKGIENGWKAAIKKNIGGPSEGFLREAYAKAKKDHFFGPDVRVNASFSFQVNDRVTASVFGQNLVGINGNKRHAYDFGHTQKAAGPLMGVYQQEPRAFGVKVDYKM